MLQGLQSPPECSPSWDSSIASATVHPFTETLIEIRRMKVKEEQQQRKESVSRIETKSLPPVRGGGAQLVRPLVLQRYSSEGEHRAATSLGSLVTPSFRAAWCHHLCLSASHLMLGASFCGGPGTFHSCTNHVKGQIVMCHHYNRSLW